MELRNTTPAVSVHETMLRRALDLYATLDIEPFEVVMISFNEKKKKSTDVRFHMIDGSVVMLPLDAVIGQEDDDIDRSDGFLVYLAIATGSTRGGILLTPTLDSHHRIENKTLSDIFEQRHDARARYLSMHALNMALIESMITDYHMHELESMWRLEFTSRQEQRRAKHRDRWTPHLAHALDHDFANEHQEDED